MIVPKYGHTAVARNLVKRRLRSLVRCQLLPTLGALELEFVVRALPSAYVATFEALEADVLRLQRRLGGE